MTVRLWTPPRRTWETPVAAPCRAGGGSCGGTVIRYRKGGNNANFTVRRLASHGVGVERTFLLRSPRVEKVEVQRQAKVRRAQLYYLRQLAGKRARLEERRKD